MATRWLIRGSSTSTVTIRDVSVHSPKSRSIIKLQLNESKNHTSCAQVDHFETKEVCCAAGLTGYAAVQKTHEVGDEDLHSIQATFYHVIFTIH